MTHVARFGLVGLLGAAMSLSSAEPGVGYYKTYAAKVPMHVVQMDIRRKDVNVAVVTPLGGIGARESWARMIGRHHPVAAITGTYFDTASGIPIGSIGVRGKAIHSGFIGTAFTYSPLTGPSIEWAKPRLPFDFGDAETYLRAGPRLLSGGKTTLWPQAEGFRDPAIFRRKPRTAVVISKWGKLMFVATARPVLLREFAAALKGIGAGDAMCLDGGGSTGLYYRGSTKIVPSRPLTNLLVAYESNAAYDAYVLQPNPKLYVARP